MTIERLDEDLHAAMVSKDKQRVSVLRMLKSAVKNEMIDKRLSTLSEEALQATVRRLIKQTKDALSDFEKGARQELVEQAHNELNILQAYMPEVMSEAEIIKLIAEAKAQFPEVGKGAMGKLMGVVMKAVAGRADGEVVKKLVEKSLST